MTSQTQHRELSVTEILSKSVSLYLARFGFFLVPFLLKSLLSAALGELMDLFVPDLVFSLNFTEEFFLQLINYLAVAIPVAAVFFVVGRTIVAVLDGVVVAYSSDLLEGRHTNIKRGFSFVVSNISSLFGAGFITGVLMILGYISFIAPGAIVAIVFSLSVQVIMIERLGTLESLRRSRKLVAKRWGKTSAVLFSVLFISAVAYVIGDVVGGSLGGDISILKRLVTSILTSAVQPLYSIALTFLYYSLRIREQIKELEIPFQPTIPVTPLPSRPPMPTLPVFQPRFCYKCGRSLPSDAAYCPQCGVRVRP